MKQFQIFGITITEEISEDMESVRDVKEFFKSCELSDTMKEAAVNTVCLKLGLQKPAEEDEKPEVKTDEVVAKALKEGAKAPKLVTVEPVKEKIITDALNEAKAITPVKP